MSLIISSIQEPKNFYQRKGKKYLHELFEKWDPEHLEIDEEFNDGLEDNVGDERNAESHG